MLWAPISECVLNVERARFSSGADQMIWKGSLQVCEDFTIYTAYIVEDPQHQRMR